MHGSATCTATIRKAHAYIVDIEQSAGVTLLIVGGRTLQVDDADLCGEHSGGKPGKGSENKEPFVTTLELNEENKPIYIKLNQGRGFMSNAIENRQENTSSLWAEFFPLT
jgi:hypothetical protein